MWKIWERLSSRTPKRAVRIQNTIVGQLFDENPFLGYVPIPERARRMKVRHRGFNHQIESDIF
jgi:hypothetical protein